MRFRVWYGFFHSFSLQFQESKPDHANLLCETHQWLFFAPRIPSKHLPIDSDLQHEMAPATSQLHLLLCSQSPSFSLVLEHTKLFPTSRPFLLGWNTLLPVLHLSDASLRSQLIIAPGRPFLAILSGQVSLTTTLLLSVTALMVSFIIPRIICYCTFTVYVLVLNRFTCLLIVDSQEWESSLAQYLAPSKQLLNQSMDNNRIRLLLIVTCHLLSSSA